jgi:hypothetical protein
MAAEFDLKIYIGAGLLRFGMTRKQVEDVLSPPDKTKRTTFRNETQEFRRDNGLQTVYSAAEDTLVEISFYGNQSVAFEAMDVFQTPGTEVIRRLSEADGKPLETVGILVFLNLGIAMTGFLQEDEPGQKSISVFAKGRWDSEIEDLKPFKMKKK